MMLKIKKAGGFLHFESPVIPGWHPVDPEEYLIPEDWGFTAEPLMDDPDPDDYGLLDKGSSCLGQKAGYSFYKPGVCSMTMVQRRMVDGYRKIVNPSEVLVDGDILCEKALLPKQVLSIDYNGTAMIVDGFAGRTAASINLMGDDAGPMDVIIWRKGGKQKRLVLAKRNAYFGAPLPLP